MPSLAQGRADGPWTGIDHVPCRDSSAANGFRPRRRVRRARTLRPRSIARQSRRRPAHPRSTMLPTAPVIVMTTDMPNATLGSEDPTDPSQAWWVWACWRAKDLTPVFLYGCAAQVRREPKAATATQLPLAGSGTLTMRHQVVSAADFAPIRKALAAGEISLQTLFGPECPTAPVRTERRIIHAALGHSAAHIHAYSSMPDFQQAFGIDGDATTDTLAQLERELGFPFGDDYVSHIGNFEILTLAGWGERWAPFLIETVATPAAVAPSRSPRAMVIARTPEFASVRHFAHVVIRETNEILAERFLELAPGVCRSETIAVEDVIDSFEFYLFAENGSVLHRETGHFIREVGVNMAVVGPTIVVQDALTRRATGASASTAQAASNVQTRTSSRIRVAPESGPLSFRSYAARVRAFARAHSPHRSDDRFFNRSVDNEVAAIRHLNSMLDGGTIREAVLVDPYFGADALQLIATRLGSRDVRLTVVTSCVKIDPDTGVEFTPGQSPTDKLDQTLNQLRPFINIQLKLVNLTDHNQPAFHDRYLLVYAHEGPPTTYLLSNSLNRIAGKWPFCMSRLADDIQPEIQAYIEGLTRGEDVTGCTSPQITYSWPARV